MCSELTPHAHVPDNRIPQLMQPCSWTMSKMCQNRQKQMKISIQYTINFHYVCWIQFRRLFNIICSQNIQIKRLFSHPYSQKIQFQNWIKNLNLALFNSKYSFNYKTRVLNITRWHRVMFWVIVRVVALSDDEVRAIMVMRFGATGVVRLLVMIIMKEWWNIMPVSLRPLQKLHLHDKTRQHCRRNICRYIVELTSAVSEAKIQIILLTVRRS